MAHATPTGKSAQTTPTLSDIESYALAKQIPDLAGRGCTISTAYGDICIPVGRLSARLAELLHREISKGGVLQ
ncbi:hypothetical protein LHU53_12380 [Rhodoferax sp. U2-2l]|uniref:hypothetical protein n=1 Tax=Rhodoferax sp. U2-2l TaxID=2884000 RepID=UPI001D0A1069|nr:hypothetical protein [Rhodoferax sp. U2-2l]MCB8747701.1 hypothetical protein [Rhodoferax sp. U2-2l]